MLLKNKENKRQIQRKTKSIVKSLAIYSCHLATLVLVDVRNGLVFYRPHSLWSLLWKRYVNRDFLRLSFCTRVLEFVCFYWNLCTCIRICMRVLEFVSVYWNLYACITVCIRGLEFVCVYWTLYACFRICMRVCTYGPSYKFVIELRKMSSELSDGRIHWAIILLEKVLLHFLQSSTELYIPRQAWGVAANITVIPEAMFVDIICTDKHLFIQL